MKKIAVWIFAAVLALGGMGTLTGCTKRSEQLKLYSQGEYMDEAIFEEFEDWYKEQTGKTVKVSMTDFLSNEDMYTMISVDKADYDLICPSDYMVEKMIKEGLVQKVDKAVLDIAQADLFMPEYIEATRAFDPTLEYSVPYMFGTFGIMYNYQTVGRHLTSWADLFEDIGHKTSLKASPRDTYHAASLYVARESLRGLSGQAQKDAVQAVFDNASAQNVAATVSAVTEWKKGNGKVWDDENGKFDMAAGDLDIGLYWSCDAGYVMSNYENDSGSVTPGNKNLWYTIPEEGGNVYLDSFVINKYAVNTEAANYFLQFLCQKEAAIANSLYCGAISPVAAAYTQLKSEYEAMNLTDADSMFKGTSAEWKQMVIDMLFPPASVLNRCGQMHDYGTDESRVVKAMADLIHS